METTQTSQENFKPLSEILKELLTNSEGFLQQLRSQSGNSGTSEKKDMEKSHTETFQVKFLGRKNP